MNDIRTKRLRETVAGASPRQVSLYKEMDNMGTPARTRKPNDQERNAASKAGREIKRALVQGTRVSRTPYKRGPGKLRTRAVIRQAIDDQSGMPTHRPKPFLKKRRTHMPDTPVSVGIVIDMSASMGDLAAIAHSLRWIASEACHQAGGEVAVAGWTGGAAWPIQAPGERDRKIREPWCQAGHHAFTASFWLVEEALGLMEAEGARTLLVFSDYQLIESYEQSAAATIIPMCLRAGVGVVSVVPNLLAAAARCPAADNGVSKMIEMPGGSEDPSAAAARLAPLLARSVREAAEAASSKGRR